MTRDDDDAAIERLIVAQFSALSWRVSNGPDTETFLAGFLSCAIMLPAYRPIAATTPVEFAARMERLSRTELTEFKEASHGIFLKRVGSVAVALAGCEMHENKTTVTRDVSAFLLVKDDRGWRIAAQAWDVVDTFPQFGFV